MRVPADAWAPAPFTNLRRAYYRAIAADPASHFSSYTAIQSQNWSSRRDNERHYKTMPLEALAALPVKDLASQPAPRAAWSYSVVRYRAWNSSFAIGSRCSWR